MAKQDFKFKTPVRVRWEDNGRAKQDFKFKTPVRVRRENNRHG